MRLFLKICQIRDKSISIFWQSKTYFANFPVNCILELGMNFYGKLHLYCNNFEKEISGCSQAICTIVERKWVYDFLILLFEWVQYITHSRQLFQPFNGWTFCSLEAFFTPGTVHAILNSNFSIQRGAFVGMSCVIFEVAGSEQNESCCNQNTLDMNFWQKDTSGRKKYL